MITLMRSTRDRKPGPAHHRTPPRFFALAGSGRNTASLRLALEEEGISAGVAAVQELEGLLDSVRAELVVLGPELEGDRLLGLVSRLSQQGARVLFLAPRADAELARAALEAGAHDVLPPPHSGQAIVFRADVLQARDRSGRGASSGRLRFGERVLDREGRRLKGGEAPVSLSGREFELLDRLLKEEGGVVRREALLRDIWGPDQDSESVLDATVHRLRRKIEKNLAEPRHLTTVRGVGYRLEPTP